MEILWKCCASWPGSLADFACRERFVCGESPRTWLRRFLSQDRSGYGFSGRPSLDVPSGLIVSARAPLSLCGAERGGFPHNFHSCGNCVETHHVQRHTGLTEREPKRSAQTERLGSAALRNRTRIGLGSGTAVTKCGGILHKRSVLYKQNLRESPARTHSTSTGFPQREKPSEIKDLAGSWGWEHERRDPRSAAQCSDLSALSGRSNS